MLTHSYSNSACVEEGRDQKFMVMLVYIMNLRLTWAKKKGNKYKFSIDFEYLALLNGK